MHQFYQLFQEKFFIAAITLFSVFPPAIFAQETVDGIVRIKVSEDLSRDLESRNISRTPSGDIITGIQSIDRIHKQFNVNKLQRVFPDAGRHEARHRRHGLHLWYEVKMDKHVPVSDVLRSYQSDKNILRAEAVLQKAIVGSSQNNFGPRVVTKTAAGSDDALPEAPNDPLLRRQWHYNNTGQSGGTAGADISLFEAWRTETGRPEVVIAVTDGGIQTDHPDLAANMWKNGGEIPGNNLDDDNNGYIDDIHGYSFVSGKGSINPHEHGTHVAGTLAAVNNNGAGVAGVAGGSGNGDGIRLMSCAVFDYDNGPDGFAEAYVYSADNGAVISQNSWGYTAPGIFEQVVLDAIDYFIEEAGKNELGQQTGPMNGGIVIFSTGNFNDEGHYYPAFYEPVFSVTATNHHDVKAYYANYGAWVDIAAPGGETHASEDEGVISTLPNGTYGAFMGTSMACPHVSGVAGLVVSRFGKQGFSPDALRARLLLSVDKIETRNPNYAGKLGSGRLNAALAVRQGDQSPPEVIDDLMVTGTEVGQITLSWTSPLDKGDFVAGYDLRYSTAPITAHNFSDATKVEDVPSPAPPGTIETFTVTNLPGGTIFYFAIRALDFEGNISGLSNVISKRSALTPKLVATPLEIREAMKTAEKSTRTFTIGNDGKGLLKFTILAPGDNSFATIKPSDGQLPPGAKQTITVHFDAAQKRSGTYSQNAVITSNDPERKAVTVKLILDVTDNGAPVASVEPETVDFKSVQVGNVVHRKINVFNAGSDPLVIADITSDNAAFSFDFKTPFTLNPFERTDIRVNFAPRSAGQFDAVIGIATNDPVNHHLRVHVRGEGLHGAPVTAAPGSFDETLSRGAVVTRTMILRNNGSQERAFRLEVMNTRLRTKTSSSSSARTAGMHIDSTRIIAGRKLAMHHEKFEALSSDPESLAAPMVGPQKNRSASGRKTYDKTPAYKREPKKYVTGFEEFTTGPLGDQNGWFTAHGWTIAEEDPDSGVKHLRGVSNVSGMGETYAISPYLFEYEEFYYPQYSSVNLRLNLDNANGTTWEVVPQDPWSYVATRIRFNADRSIEAMVIGNEYDVSWKKVPVKAPAGYFDLAVEYNNAGSDTSGFPTYYLFINNVHVFSGTGLGSGIGQVAFVSKMEENGPVLDIDNVQLIGGEYIPPFLTTEPDAGIIPPGRSVTVKVKFDASIVKAGTYESDLVVHLDEIDSLVVPVTLAIPGDPSYARDLNSIYIVAKKDEIGTQEMSMINTGGTPIDFRFEHDIPGLTFDPVAAHLGIREVEVVKITFDGAPGVYEDEVLIHTNISSEPDRMQVHVTKMDKGGVFYAPREINLHTTAGERSSQNMEVRNDGINTVSFIATIQDLDSVITIDPPKGTVSERPMALTLNVDATHLSPGTYTGMLRFTTNDPDRRSVYTVISLNVISGQVAGTIMRETWTGIQGTQISKIPLAGPPSATEVLSRFQSPSNAGDNYGARIRGWVEAPVSGAYTFWISSNDHSELWLSTDDKEHNKARIAHITGHTDPLEWNKFKTQMSQPINLVANRRYYIEALHKEGIGTDHLAVGWRLPDGTLERPIPGMRLIPYSDEPANSPPLVTIIAPEEGEVLRAPATVPIHAKATDRDGSVVKVEFFNGTTELATDLAAPYLYYWANVPAGIHTITAKATDNEGAVDSTSVNIYVVGEESCQNSGNIHREQWNGIPGTLIKSIPTDTDPASTEVLTLFESPSDIGDNYGARIKGFLCVPASGNYTFWIAGNDKSELWLSSDANPANKKRIAHVPYYTQERQWRKFADQKSAPVYLEQGHSYYIEALHKEGIGTDHLSVGWQLPDGTLERPIPGMRLVPYEDLGIAPRVSISHPDNGHIYPARGTIEITADATDEDGRVSKVDFYVGTMKVAEDATAPYQASWSAASEGTYRLSAVAIDDQGLSARSVTVDIIVEPACGALGSITREWWTGIPGNHVSSIPVTTTPQGSESLTIFEAPSNAGTNYGARIRGYICPPATGVFYFFISSNDHSELWLSTDDTEGKKQRIASITGATEPRQWNKFRSQKSAGITLTRGKTYYIEALHKQGSGTDHLAVGWQLPDGTLERPIAGSHLTPARLQAATAASLPSFEGEEPISVDVYPNPVHGQRLSIVIDNRSGKEDATGEISIRQLTGMSVYSEKIKCDGGCRTEIDVQKNLTPGLYILQVKTGRQTFTEKLIVP